MKAPLIPPKGGMKESPTFSPEGGMIKYNDKFF